MQPLRWRATFQSMVVKTSRNLLGVPANRSEPTVWIWFVQTYKTVTTATVERRRWSRIRIRKESDLQTNRTINCVYWYLEFTYEKPPWVENHKTLNEIHHICLEASSRNFFITRGPERILRQWFFKWIPLFHFYFHPWFGNITNALRTRIHQLLYILCVSDFIYNFLQLRMRRKAKSSFVF